MNRSILIVDDDRDMVATLADILEMHDWHTLKGYNGADAIRLATENDVDAVLMDVRMPTVDGLTALSEIKARRPNTRVVLMTAFMGNDLLERAEKEGALRVLKKPLDPPVLLQLLEEAGRSRPVLVVDDDPVFLRSLADVLVQHGFQTMEAQTLDEALRLMRQQEPQAILLDLRLDHVDPRSNMLAIRQLDPTVLLILFSGNPYELSRTVTDAAPGMIDAAFTKPIQIDRLLAVLGGAERA